MQVNEVISVMLSHCPKSQEAVSIELGRAKSWASVVKSSSRIPRLDTVTDIADACGYDVQLVSRDTGAAITVTPPRRC